MNLRGKISTAQEIMDFAYRFKFRRDKMYPRTAIFDITYDCNLRCKMCWRSVNESPEPEFSGGQLKLEDTQKIVDLLVSKGLKKIIVAGGDPFMYPHIVEFTNYIKKKGLRGTIITNAALLNEKFAKHLLDIGWDEIAVSLDGYDSKTHDKIRGRGVFEKATKNIRNLNELKEAKGGKKPKIGMHSIVMDHTHKNLENFVDLANELEMRYVGYTRLLPWSPNYRRLRLKEKNIPQAKESMERANIRGKKIGIHTNAIDFFEERYPDFCYFIYNTIFLNPNGDMLVCCRMTDSTGNVLRDGIDGVWFSERMNKLREAFNKGQVPNICKTCNLSNIKHSNRMKKLIDKIPF